MNLLRWSRLASVVFAALAIVATASASVAQEKVLDDAEEHLFRGDMLYLQGDYYRALGEYKSFLLMSPDDERASRVDLKMAWIYYLADRPAASAAILRNVARANEDEPLALWSTLYTGQALMKAEDPLPARRAYERVVEACEPILAGPASAQKKQCFELAASARLGLARYHAKLGQFDRAVEHLEAVPDGALQREDARSVAEHVSSLDIPRKSPFLAGALSIVPGLGHFYLEEWTIGIVAMIWNGVFIFATVDSFVAGRYGQGTLLGLFELIWYGGTIFGAVAGAHRFNRDAVTIVREGLTDDIDALSHDTPWPGRFPVQYPTPLQLRLRF